MQESLVTFETAKLAKEKRFGWDKFILWSAGMFVYLSDKNKAAYKKIITTLSYSPENYQLPAPTQSLLQKWLREIHKIEVLPDYDFIGYSVKIMNGNTGKEIIASPKKVDDFTSYEKTFEFGLFKALEQIKL